MTRQGVHEYVFAHEEESTDPPHPQGNEEAQLHETPERSGFVNRPVKKEKEQ